MAGLSRSKNLSERNLNLKTALQKLYAPGIENDIDLFSISSKITSTIVGGPEVLQQGDILSQVYGIESQKLKTVQGTNFTVLDRTKFKTRYYTFTNDNLVYFTKLDIPGIPSSAKSPIFSREGSVPSIKLVYGGRGFYLNNPDGSVYLPNTGPSQFRLKNVIFIGGESSSETLRGTVTFTKEATPSGNLDYLYRFTPSSSDRYYITAIEITDSGSGYFVPEALSIKLDQEYIVETAEARIVLKKQQDEVFVFTNPIIRTDLYFYRVVNADASGFFLFDEANNEFIFLDRTTESLTSESIEIRRKDSIRIENLLRFRFAGSIIRIRDYGESYQIGDSISGELASLGGSVQNLITSVSTAVQNTKLPTSSTSPTNQLGYSYNSFVGRDVVVWQRLVIRDQDYLLDPGAPGSRTGLTGQKLKDDVENFRLALTPKTLSVTNYVSNGTTTVVATVSTTAGLSEGDSFTIADASGSEQSKLNGTWQILSLVSSTQFTFLVTSAPESGTYTLNLGTLTITPNLRVPGLFIKVGTEYFRAFSTTDKPFLQEISGIIANPNLSNNRSFTDSGALSAESQFNGQWYSYNTQISQLAQRIAYDSSEPNNKLKSKNGAFYFHRSSAPSTNYIRVRRGTNPNGFVYGIPLFTAS